MTDEKLQKQYPRFCPLVGIDPLDGNPANHRLVKTLQEHEAVNPEDFHALLNETAPSPTSIQEHIDQALIEARLAYGDTTDRAVADERERCAKIAEGSGGRAGMRIANVIRGASADEGIPE